MIALSFFEIPRIARSSSTVYSHPDFSLVPASNRTDVEIALDSRIINAILVPARSADCWFAVERQIASRITMPRILVVTSAQRSKLWTPRLAHESGFDGLVINDPESAISQFAERFKMAVHSSTTAGSREPVELSDLARCPTVEEITLGDPLNARILELTLLGLTHEEISHALDRAPQTIRNRVSRMIRSSGTRNHTELVLSYEQALVRQDFLVGVAGLEPETSTESSAER